MIVKLVDGPLQFTDPFAKVGVTVMVAVTGDVPRLIALNDAMFPLPLAARPMLGVLLVHA